MLDKDLRELIESKEHKSFWGVFDNLSMYGYKPIDVLGGSLAYFKESEIWNDVAYAKLETSTIEIHSQTLANFEDFDHYGNGVGNRVITQEKIVNLKVGMITEDIEHLRGLYHFYKKMMANGKLSFNDGMIKEIETNCSVIYTLENISPFVLMYLKDSSEKHFGYNLLNEDIYEPSSLNPGDIARMRRGVR